MEDQEFKAFKEEENSARVYERLLFSYCVCDKRINSCVGTSFFEKKNFSCSRRFFLSSKMRNRWSTITVGSSCGKILRYIAWRSTLRKTPEGHSFKKCLNQLLKNEIELVTKITCCEIS